jgi:Ca-activated chloride channel family protein
MSSMLIASRRPAAFTASASSIRGDQGAAGYRPSAWRRLLRVATVAACGVLLAAPFAGVASARQQVNVDIDVSVRLDNATDVVMPQAGTWHIGHRHVLHHHVPGRVEIDSIDAHVVIREQTASTTLELRLVNRGDDRAEAVLLLPVPSDAAVSGFLFDGPSAEPTARLLPRDEARRIYDDIVRQVRDPALLEFAGYNLIRSSVFPVEPRGAQRVRLTYESVLEGDGTRVDYILPRSESLLAAVPWNIEVEIEAASPVSMIYSPSHDLVESRHDARRVNVRVADSSKADPGAFRLSYLIERDGVSASLFAYPDPKVGGGYFLLLASLPAPPADHQAAAIRREVTLVLDRSGSMAGGKLDQVRAAAMQIVEALADGEAFNIIDYSHAVAMFAPKPVVKNADAIRQAREYLSGLRPNGGTNIHDSLVEALRQPPTADMLPLVLFLTDGLPTVGNTSEVAIRDLVEKHNQHDRRVFTFGVGADVNVPLLERLAEASRAKTTFVLPGEDVELKVAQTFKRLSGPVLAGVDLRTLASDGSESTRLVRELVPSILPDVFEGDQIILLGQYADAAAPVTFEVSGDGRAGSRTLSFTFDFDGATTNHAFVPRLWAARRIAFLVDEIRQAGALTNSAAPPASVVNDPRFKEVIDEIVRLSTEFGILSEYTAFLATEGTNLADWNRLVTACGDLLNERAVQTRSGLAALNQGFNSIESKQAAKLNYQNYHWNAQMERVAFANVQQMNDKCFFAQQGVWIDASAIAKEQAMQDAQTLLANHRVIEFGTPEHMKLVYDLAACNRQGAISLPGDILLEHEGELVVVRNGAVPQE